MVEIEITKCGTCGHSKRRHPKGGACTAICNCSRFITAAEAIRDAAEAGRQAAARRFPTGGVVFVPSSVADQNAAEYAKEIYDSSRRISHEPVGNYRPDEEPITTPHEGMKNPTLKCAREGCGHYYGNHPKIDDIVKMQAHWVCIECDCKEFMFNPLLSVNTIRRALELEKHPVDDPVNHPSHYTAYPGIEVIQLTRHMSFNRGNAVKYIARAGLKNKDTEVQDLEKAIWYLQDEVKLLKGEYNVEDSQ